jgi:hypothetical protein
MRIADRDTTTRLLPRRRGSSSIISPFRVFGSFTGYGSVFGVLDLQREIVDPGAFTRTLIRELPVSGGCRRAAQGFNGAWPP